MRRAASIFYLAGYENPMTADCFIPKRWWLWCPQCGRLPGELLCSQVQLVRAYDEHQATCPKKGQAAASESSGGPSS